MSLVRGTFCEEMYTYEQRLIEREHDDELDAEKLLKGSPSLECIVVFYCRIEQNETIQRDAFSKRCQPEDAER